MPDRKTRSLEAALAEAKRQFASRSYDAVSVSDIAVAAKCSTATIYDVYGNKMGLYVAAARDYVSSLLDELDAYDGDQSALQMLIAHLELRAERFATPSVREMIRNVISQITAENFKAGPELGANLVKRYAKLLETVQSAIGEGDLRPYPAHYVTDILLAHIGWRPLFHGLLLGSSVKLNFPPAELAWRSLMPFLTAQGRRNYALARPALTQLLESMP